LRSTILTLAVAALAAISVTGQEKKEPPKAPMMKTAILHPDMTPGAGTWDKPMATLGTKPSQPWTATTVAAGVDNKPQPGKAITVIGEVVDEHPGLVMMKTRVGGTRVVDMLSGEQLPRIC